MGQIWTGGNRNVYMSHPQAQTISFYCLWSMRFSYLAAICSSVLVTLTSFYANGSMLLQPLLLLLLLLHSFVRHFTSSSLSLSHSSIFSHYSLRFATDCWNKMKFIETVYNCNHYMSFRFRVLSKLACDARWTEQRRQRAPITFAFANIHNGEKFYTVSSQVVQTSNEHSSLGESKETATTTQQDILQL